ncbi:MAG: HIRAN domain-containing protein [Proteobacteria bacterium]|nr:HIRAN domain-containing protein [Pseudomonadota bacterium]
MSDSLVKLSSSALSTLISGEAGEISLPKPFERDIFLFDTIVAGTSYIDGIEELEPFMKEGDKLEFFREPNNSYDDMAIMIKNVHGIKIGYVPRKDNIIFSRLMDAGKVLFGEISHKEWRDRWLKIDIKIYLHE